MRRGEALAVVALAAAVGAAALYLALSSDNIERPAFSGALFVAVALAFVVTGVVAAARRPANKTGLLMIATGFSWFLGSITASENAFVFTVGAALGAIPYAFVVALALGFPTGQLRGRWDRGLVAATVLLATVGQALFLLVASPADICSAGVSCPDNLLRAIEDDTADMVIRWSLNGLIAATVIAIVVRLTARWRQASAALRRALGPVFAASGAAFVLVAARLIANDVSDSAADALWVVQILALLGIPLAFLLGLLRSRLARGSVALLGATIGSGVPLRDALADALGDPQLRVGYWVEERSEYLDDSGHVFAYGGGGRAQTIVRLQGRPVAALDHDVALAEEPELIDAVTGAAALALDAERMKTEMRAQVALQLAIIETVPSLLLNVAPDGRVLNQNRAVVAACGLDSEDDVRGRYFWDLIIAAEERAAVQERFRALAPDFPPGRYENTFTNARGERVVIVWETAPVVDDAGKVVSIITGGLDITERERQADELRASDERLRAAIESSPVAIVEVDLEERVLTWNGAAERMFGWKAEEVIGRRVPLRPPEHETEWRRRDVELRRGMVLSGLEATRRHKSGEDVAVEISAAPVRDAEGAVVGLMALYMDVSERQQREQQLQRERDITSTLMNAIPSLVVVVDPEATIVDSGVDASRAGVNEAVRTSLGWPDEWLVRRSMLELVHPDDRPEAMTAVQLAVDGATSAEQESRWLRADGSEMVIAWTATPVDDVTGRRASLVLVSGIDVTERKRHEEEIRASRSRIIEAADAARRVLERNLHDGAQQRLVALALTLRLAEAKAQTTPEDAIPIIAGARVELAAAIEELRELARGLHPAILTDRGLPAAIDALVARTPLPVQVEAHPVRLPAAVEAAAYYVVAEALTNVTRYARASSARVTLEQHDGVVVVEVADDGVGGADVDRGTGLRGLHDRLAALDGDLSVISTLGQGTRVRAVIPLG